jgi:hypothetical protein
MQQLARLLFQHISLSDFLKKFRNSHKSVKKMSSEFEILEWIFSFDKDLESTNSCIWEQLIRFANQYDLDGHINVELYFNIDLISLASSFPKLAESTIQNISSFEAMFQSVVHNIYRSKLFELVPLEHQLSVYIRFYNFPKNLQHVQESHTLNRHNQQRIFLLNGFILHREKTDMLIFT